MKLIPLSQNSKTNAGKYFAKVNDEDYDWLNQWKWCIDGNGYAVRGIYLGGGRRNAKIKGIKMHRLIMDLSNGDIEIDHIDGDRLNNQRNNLRICSPHENSLNARRSHNKGTSQYKGVYYRKKNDAFIARICFKRTDHYLGIFKNEGDAAIAYNNAAIKFFGEFASLNMVQ